MFLEIITPEKKLYSGEVSLVQLPGTDGLFEILESHAPLVSTLNKGKIKIKNTSDNIEFYDINGGIVEVNNNIITILGN